MRQKHTKWIVAAIFAALCLGGCKGGAEEYRKQAEQYLQRGEYGLALEQYNKAIMEDDGLQEAYRGAGIASMKLADYETAQDLFLRALKESDGRIGTMEVDLSYYLGEVQIQLEQYEEAEKTYSALIEYDEDQADAYFYRGVVYLKLGEEKKADADLKKAAEKGDLSLLYGIYEAYQQQGSEKGQAYLDKITAAKPKSAEDYYALGMAYYSQGDAAQAQKALAESEKKGFAQASFFQGTIAWQSGDFECALEYYKTYKEKQGLTIGQYHTVAECLVALGRYEEALALNEEMGKNAGESEQQSLLYEAIVLCERGGNFEEAKSRAAQYVESYPDDADGQKEYQFLQTR